MSVVTREDVRQAHELDELEELVARVAEPYLTATAPRGELQSRDCVDRHGIGLDPGDVAANDGPALVEDRTHTPTETRQVLTG